MPSRMTSMLAGGEKKKEEASTGIAPICVRDTYLCVSIAICSG